MNRYVSLISRYPCFITYKILTILGIRNTYYDLTSYLTQLLSSVILLKDVILFIFFSSVVPSFIEPTHLFSYNFLCSRQL